MDIKAPSKTIQLRKRTEPTGDIYYETYNGERYVVDSMVWGGNASSSESYKSEQLKKAIVIYNNVVINKTPSIEVLMQTIL